MEDKSRTRIKKEATALQKLGESLVYLPFQQLEQMDLPEEILEAVKFAKKIKKHGAYRRQMQYIGALMREFDPEPIRQALEQIDAAAYQRTVEARQTGKIRDELVAGDDENP